MVNGMAFKKGMGARWGRGGEKTGMAGTSYKRILRTREEDSCRQAQE